MVAESTINDVENQIEGADDEEAIAQDIAPNKRTISTRSADPEIESLHGKWRRGKLVLQPFFQRHFVWDRKRASRLIESALLAVPLPIIYLAEEPDGKESVIDGQQRLTAFFSFLDGRLPDGEVFRLTGLEVFPDLNRKTYQELPEELQDKIRYYQIRTITILEDSNSELKFEIFERLNTGSVPLNDMELRNCVYYGPYMDLLKALADDSDYKQLIGFKGPDTRMRDVDFVLRFAAFYHATYLKYQGPMRRFMNADMKTYRNITDAEADKLRKAFKNAVQIIKSLFGENAFRRYSRGDAASPNGAWERTRINASLFDVLMGVFCTKDKNQVYAALDSLREGIIDLMVANDAFIDAILLGTSTQARVTKRFDLMRMRVDEILEAHPQQPRCFTLQLKQELFANDPTCAICGQRIQQIDDAAVDHIEQYWRGGQTIPENARLAHRYCNMARLRND